MKRFYVFAMLNGETVREAITPANDAIQALHVAGFLPESLAPEYDSARDRAHFITPDSNIILAAQRA